jgi:hypothetical protein
MVIAGVKVELVDAETFRVDMEVMPSGFGDIYPSASRVRLKEKQ